MVLREVFAVILKEFFCSDIERVFCSDIERVFCSDIDRGFFAVILKEVFCSDIERGDFNRKRVGRVSINIGKRERLPTKRKNCNLQTPWKNII